jgi:hypothetical protein
MGRKNRKQGRKYILEFSKSQGVMTLNVSIINTDLTEKLQPEADLSRSSLKTGFPK